MAVSIAIQQQHPHGAVSMNIGHLPANVFTVRQEEFVLCLEISSPQSLHIIGVWLLKEESTVNEGLIPFPIIS